MAPSPHCEVKKRVWFKTSWILERMDPNSFVHNAIARPILGDDGNGEVLRDHLQCYVVQTKFGEGIPARLHDALKEKSMMMDYMQQTYRKMKFAMLSPTC